MSDIVKTIPAASYGASLVSYDACIIKRFRSTALQTNKRRDAIFDIVQASWPMTVRQVFYQATVQGIAEKSEAGYTKVQRDLVIMRREGRLPYEWLADNTRWQRKPITYSSIDDALTQTARYYRKSLWENAPCYVEIWLEKDALAGVVTPITDEYDVPLMVARGYASLSFLYEAAQNLGQRCVPIFIYHLGDFDPSGVNAGEKIEETLRELAPEAEIYFRRIGVTPEQIHAWNLPTRPTKMSDTRSKGFGAISVELDAIAPDELRNLVRVHIEQHLPADQLALLQEDERTEKATLVSIVRALMGGEG